MFGDLGAAIQEFQSTLSVRRATHLIDGLMYFIIISIHALREESDAFRFDRLHSEDDFNPRSP